MEYIIRHLNLIDRNLVIMTKVDEEFYKKLDFKDLKFPVKIRDIHKLKGNCISNTKTC